MPQSEPGYLTQRALEWILLSVKEVRELNASDSSPVPSQRSGQPVLLFIGILLIGFNLRASITAVGPVLDNVMHSLHLSSGTASLLISLPLIAFGVVSPFAPSLAKKYGIENALKIGLLALAAGIVVRSLPGSASIWLGTAVLGSAIAVLNVVLPSLVKRDYPQSIGKVTGIYSSLTSAGAALAAGLTVPLSGYAPDGWRFSFGIWALFAAIAWVLFLFIRTVRENEAPRTSSTVSRTVASTSGSRAASSPGWTVVLKNPTAWFITMHMGVQSAVFYIAITWWPAIEKASGLSAAQAGLHQMVMQLAGIAGNILAAIFVQRLRSKTPIAFFTSGCSLMAVVGHIILPQWGILWVIFLGLGCGSSIVFALSLVSLRTENHLLAARVSGMAQSIGYFIAAVGPIAVGVLFDTTHQWDIPLGILVAACLAQLSFGVLSSRGRMIGKSAI